MTICLIVRKFPSGAGAGDGIGAVFRQLADGLTALGHHIIVVAMASGAHEAGVTVEEGLTIHRIHPLGEWIKGAWRLEQALLPTVPVFQLRYAYHVRRTLCHLLRSRPIDAVIAPEWSAEAVCVALMKRRPALVVACHGGMYWVRKHNGARNLSSWIMLQLEALMVRRADRAVAVSHSLVSDVSRPYRVAPSRFRIIRNSIDLQRFHLNGRSENPAAAPSILCVGRLERLKGLDVLIRALPQVVQAVPGVRVELVGRDMPWAGTPKKTSEHLRGLVERDVWEHVTCHGVVPHERLPDSYHRASLCVFPSLADGFSGVVLEAMACGRPVITTSANGAAEIIEHGTDGWVVPPNDPAALAQAMVRLCHDRSLREQVGRRARATAEQVCDRERMARAYLEVIEEAVSSRKRNGHV